MTDWHEIWNRRVIYGQDQTKDPGLKDLLMADGFDTGAGTLNSLKNWEEYIALISQKIDLAPEDSIFEIGCGSGAFLYLWFREGHRVGGVDYSENLVSLANQVMKGMDFRVSEAIHVDTDEKFDIVVSNGVFHYFRDYAYAKEVVEKMMKKAKKTVAILEIPDLALKEESEKTRRAALPEGEYDRKYRGLNHLHYEREWFTRFSDTFGCSIEIFDQEIKEYANSRFRFNVVFKK
jgi:trans-aconitate methyltransferase